MTRNIQNGNPGKINDSFLKKLLYMTQVVFIVYGILGIAGFFLWFAFPVETINGLTYLKGNSLIYYYLIVNLLDIAGVLYASHIIYYKRINTSTPVKDGVLTGIYLVVASWLIDLFVYVFIRQTLPSIHEYFLGKNQPEIGIAWVIAFASALCAGWLHQDIKNNAPTNAAKKWALALGSLTLISALLTVIGISFFDIKP